MRKPRPSKTTVKSGPRGQRFFHIPDSRCFGHSWRIAANASLERQDEGVDACSQQTSGKKWTFSAHSRWRTGMTNQGGGREAACPARRMLRWPLLGCTHCYLQWRAEHSIPNIHVSDGTPDGKITNHSNIWSINVRLARTEEGPCIGMGEEASRVQVGDKNAQSHTSRVTRRL